MNASPSADRDHLHPAYILHYRDYGDASLLVEVWSPERGRLPAIAKGAKSGKGQRAALLQPFRALWVGLAGRGEVRTLTRVEAAGPILNLTGTALYAGFYLNELLLRLTPREDPHLPLFDRYLEALADLAQGDELHNCLRRFELDLLEALGYAPLLERDIGGRPVTAQRHYGYDPRQGPLPDATNCFAVSGQTLLALAGRRSLEGRQIREGRDLMRLILDTHLNGRPLRSRELLREMLRLSAPRNSSP